MLGSRLVVWDSSYAAVIDPAYDNWLPVDPANKPVLTGVTAHLVGDPEQRIYVTLPGSSPNSLASLNRVAPTGALVWQRSVFPDAGQPKLNGTLAWTGDALVAWGGYSSVPDPNGPTGCENVPPGQGCDPTVRTKQVYDAAGAAWKPVWQ